MDPMNVNLQTDLVEKKPQKAWPLGVVWAVFIIMTLIFLAFGPGVMLLFASTGGGMGAGFGVAAMEILAMEKLSFITPFVLVLSILGLFFSYKKFPAVLRTVHVLLFGVIVGLLLYWLGLYNVIPLGFMFSILAPLASVITLVVLRKKDKKKAALSGNLEPISKGKNTTLFMIVMVVLVFGLGFAIFDIFNNPIVVMRRTMKGVSTSSVL